MYFNTNTTTPDSADNSSFEYNTFEHNGTNAILDYQNNGTYLFGNYFYSNHEEFDYANYGGQIDLVNELNPTLSSNTFDGAHVSGIVGQPAGAFGCIVPGSNIGAPLYTGGVEGWYDFWLALYNNQIINHSAGGIGLGSPVNNLTISTYDPNCPGCSVASIGSNSGDGIYIQNDRVYDSTTTITVDAIVSAYNGGHGIAIYDSAGQPVSLNFTRNACLAGNSAGRGIFDPSVSVTNFPASDTCPTH